MVIISREKSRLFWCCSYTLLQVQVRSFHPFHTVEPSHYSNTIAISIAINVNVSLVFPPSLFSARRRLYDDIRKAILRVMKKRFSDCGFFSSWVMVVSATSTDWTVNNDEYLQLEEW